MPGFKCSGCGGMHERPVGKNCKKQKEGNLLSNVSQREKSRSDDPDPTNHQVSPSDNPAPLTQQAVHIDVPAPTNSQTNASTPVVSNDDPNTDIHEQSNNEILQLLRGIASKQNEIINRVEKLESSQLPISSSSPVKEVSYHSQRSLPQQQANLQSTTRHQQQRNIKDYEDEGIIPSVHFLRSSDEIQRQVTERLRSLDAIGTAVANNVKQYHREFLRAGSGVMQSFTYNSSDSKLEYTEKKTGFNLAESGEAINTKACTIAKEVANEGDALVSGCVNYTIAYKENKGKEEVQAQFRKQMQCFADAGVDFIICEYFGFIEEMEWAIQVAKEFKKPVAAMMCIGSQYDRSGVSTGECAIRMAKAGADVVGVNCNFGIYNSLNTVKVMKKALDEAGLHPYLMIQPLVFHTPETDTGRGYVELPEFILALEPRTATRFEIAKWARECYEAGIRYIGGCCGFEPYHIRAISEELYKETGKKCAVTEKYGFVLEGMKNMDIYDKKNGSEYWKNINPATGRPKSAAFTEFKKS